MTKLPESDVLHAKSIDLLERHKRGDKRAHEQLIRLYELRAERLARLNYYRAVAGGRWVGLDHNDLKQAALINLWNGLHLYDSSKGKFQVFANHRIVGGIKHELRDHSQIIPLPAHVQERLKPVVEARDLFLSKNHRPPTLDELREITGESHEFIEEFLHEKLPLLSEELSGERQWEHEYDDFKPMKFRLFLEQAAAAAGVKERDVGYLKKHFIRGLGLSEIAQEEGKSVNTVSVQIKNALKKLSNHPGFLEALGHHDFGRKG